MFPNSTALLCADSANSASLRYLFLSLARHPFSHFETPVAQPATRSVPHEQSAVALSFTSSASFISSTSFSARRLLQQLDFLPRQSPKSPRLQIQNQRPHPHPPNLLHQMPHLFEHSPYLAVPPLNQHHLVPRILPVLKKPYLRWRRLHTPPILQLNHNPSPQTRNPLLARLPAHLHQIRLRHVRTSLHHPLGQSPIIREQQQ